VIGWLKLVAAIVVAEAIEHAAEVLFVWLKRRYFK